jgi:hypothetical protein
MPDVEAPSRLNLSGAAIAKSPKTANHDLFPAKHIKGGIVP